MTGKPDLIMAWVWNLPYPSKHNGKAEWSSAIFPAEQDCAEYFRVTPERLAAPDLLAALEALDAFWLETLPNGPPADGEPHWLAPETIKIWRDARAAIAKARGQV